MEYSIRFPLTKLLYGSTNYVSCPTALLVSPKLTASARDRFCITEGERAIISKCLLGIGDEDESFAICKDSFLSGTSKDEADVKSLVEQLERFGIFSVCRPKVAAVDEVNTDHKLCSNRRH